ncbi:DUF4374 domain-containing protein [Echinicola marina]|uniref:DUF4374 domain-containing protein n=1 Tax=Echinicola marina TaxID=2859768 RepID=UPI001CF6EFE7|nr:DUF4374 domain-containing protein [Echinicola marina]UCS94010.1 DUF4374 domain-containing protein [Echinicola marina]
MDLTAPLSFSRCKALRTATSDPYFLKSSGNNKVPSAGYTKVDKPSGILRIKSGEDEFDEDYFFDIENSELQGRLVFGSYIGGNRAIIRYMPKELDNDQEIWGALNDAKVHFKMAIVDLKSKEITPITNLPDHGGEWTRQLFIEDGVVYHSFTTETETRIYAIDLATGEAEAGAVVEGATVPLIYKLDY